MNDHSEGVAVTDPQTRATVIVLGFDGRRYLEACLTSVLDQELPRNEYEVLYVDNGSSDGSAQFVGERFPEVRVQVLERNLGYAQGNNVGLKLARGRCIVFLNQDTVVHRRWLLKLLQTAESAPDIGACHSNLIMPWHPAFPAQERTGEVKLLCVPELSRFGFASYARRPYSPKPIETLFLAGACVLVKRELLEPWGYAFDPGFFAYCEDTDLALRIRAMGYRNVLVPTSVVYHHHTLAEAPRWSTLEKTLRILRNRWLVYFRNMNAVEFTAYAPFLLLGSALKAAEFGLPLWKRSVYGGAQVPLMAVAFFLALPQFARHWRERRRILRSRTQRLFWLLKELLAH